MKICNKCNLEKNISEFYRCKRTKGGYRYSCIQCTKNYNNSDYIKEKERERKLNKKEHIKEVRKKYRQNDHVKTKNSEYVKKWRLENVEYIKEKQKEKYLNNSEYYKQYRKDYEERNPEWKIEYNKKYRELNKDKLNEYHRNYINTRKQEDPLFKLSGNIRSLIYMSIKAGGYSKKSKTQSILGCTFEEFKVYLELKFTDGMNWVNMGEWHIDHIYPVSLAKDEDELIKLNHYSNLQPLWGIDNLKKGNKI